MRPRFTERLGKALAAALVALAVGPAAAADKPLVLAFVPQENPEKLLGDVRAIDLYLEAAMGRRVEARVTTDHAAAVESLAAGAADIAFMGALPYVMARERIGAAALLSEVYRGKPELQRRGLRAAGKRDLGPGRPPGQVHRVRRPDFGVGVPLPAGPFREGRPPRAARRPQGVLRRGLFRRRLSAGDPGGGERAGGRGGGERLRDASPRCRPARRGRGDRADTADPVPRPWSPAAVSIRSCARPSSRRCWRSTRRRSAIC